MVVSSQRLASEVGVDILRAGGNAVDAAVAVGYAEAVVNPCCGNIGGGGFMTLHLADGRETASSISARPRRRPRPPTCISMRRATSIKDASLHGYRAVGVPGTVMGLEHGAGAIRHDAARAA